MLKIKLLHSDAKVPTRANATDAGLDLYANHNTAIDFGERALVGTGISISIPEGYVAYVKPRSGLAVNFGIDVMAGVIDSSYRGEVKALLVNLGMHDPECRIKKGDRIAQLVIQRVELWDPVVVEELDETARGAGGFGSSGQ